MKSKSVSALAIVTLLTLMKANPIFEPTELKNTYGNRYENLFFGITIDMPEGWHLMNTTQLTTVVQQYGDARVINSSDLIGLTAARLKNKLLPLFSFVKYPYGTQDKSNPTIICIIESVPERTELDNECEPVPYPNNANESNCRVVTLNGYTFTRKQSMMNLDDGKVIKQIQYTRKTKDGYYLLFTLSYDDDTSKQDLENVMKSLKISHQ
ncbi:unnamed protein product [Adineta ricciae]|uniref:Uncharacterized protein n=1 Tax=Adineta ricciae TaxID=249248 RepID=A0A814L0P1_ADIRI|nr:unnamed protein product [Adineta ricciae]CAF1196045.1 unnamed protein product [Adineta ricciae]